MSIDLPAIRPTMRTRWRNCPRQVYYPWVAGIEPRESRKALVIGSAYHAGIEELRTSHDAERAMTVARRTLRSLAAAMAPLAPYVEEQVASYVGGYAKRFDDIANDNVVETPVFDPDDGEGGTADCVARFPDGSIWVVEDKTTAMFTDREAMAMALRRNDQLTTYVHALRQRGIPVKGARYRQVKKTMTKQTQKETLGGYSERIFEIYQNDPDVYREIVLEWGDEELDRCFRERERTNLDMIVWFDQLDVADWPYNPNACVGPYGPCEFLQLCTRGRDASERLYQPREGASLDGGSYQRKIWEQIGDGSQIRADPPNLNDIF